MVFFFRNETKFMRARYHLGGGAEHLGSGYQNIKCSQ